MLGKLLKHEFKATGRVMLPFFGALLVLSVMVWLSINVFFFNFGGVSIIGGIVLTLYFMLLASIGIVTLVLLVYRFYRSFLSDEGYMTFSLPAGRYCSLRVVIGSGEGHNWWCVVFPPLCTAAVTEQDELPQSVASLSGVALGEPKYALRFRSMELWGELRELFK